MRRPFSSRLLPVLAALVLCALPVTAGAEGTTRVTAVVRLDDGSLGLEEHVVARSAVAALVASLEGDPRVLAAGPVHERTLVADTAYQVDDPLASSQWGWRRLGGARLGEVGDGSGLVVAVLDTGVDASHPDLAGRVLPGWDSMDPTGDGRRDPNGHGTHVAGIIAAAAGNGEGVAGVAPAVDILPVRVLDASGNGDDDDLALGIIWAVDNGADILNLSIGGAVPSTLLEGAIDHALDSGVLVVVAAGNAGATGNEPSYPAAYQQVLAVAATDSSDRRAMFSNTGSYVDVAAPGSWIVSTWPGARYQTSSGTSMAAPFVTGAAALVQARTGLEGRALAARLVADAVDLGPAGADAEYGAGLVNPLATIGVVPDPIPEGERAPVIPGLPALPSLPELPELVMPELPELVMPELPELPAMTLPPLPKLVAPSLPAHTLPSPARPEVPSLTPGELPSSVPQGPRAGIGLRLLGPTPAANSSREIRVVLEGPRALVARQRVVATIGSLRREAVTNWQGVARIRVPSSATGVLTVEFAGSVSVRPARAEMRLTR